MIGPHKGSMIHTGLVLMSFLVGAIADRDILVYSRDPSPSLQDDFQDMPARFGGELPAEGLRGFVIAGQPSNGCSTLKPPPTTTENFTGNWIVLLARYNCTFEVKVRNAQAANYDAVIIHNVDSNELEIMSADNPKGIDIPSVFVGATAGIILEATYQYDNNYFVIINGNFPFNNYRLLLPFAIVVALCLVIMIVFMVIRGIRQHRRSRRHRLPNSSLKKIPICKFAKGDPYDTCAICLDDYVEGDKLRVLPCAHAYHCKCIDPWLTKNRRVCPVCKRKVFAAGERRSRRNREETNQNTRHSSDSDSDDDRTPLVNSRSDEQVTQGGTFQRQRENPFRQASRLANRNRNEGEITNEQIEHENSESRTTQGGSWPGGPFLTGVLNLRGNLFPSNNQFDEESLNDDRQSLLAAGPSIASRSPSLRMSTGKEKSADGKSRKISSDSSSKRSRKSSKTSSRHHRRQGSDSNSERSRLDGDESNAVNNQLQIQNPDVSQNLNDVESQNEAPPNEVGRIGVAALPNINISENQRQRNRRNDFIV